MKKILKYLVVSCLALLVGGLMTACGESHTPDDSSSNDLPALSTPTNVRADFWKLTWDEVENATGYVVRFPDLGSEFETTETTLSLFEYFTPGEKYYIDVKAVGDGVTYGDSEWKNTGYNAEPVTEGLNYTLLEDGTYQVTCDVENIPKNGELVLPDKYNARYVTRYAPQRAFGGEIPYTSLSKVRLPAQLKELYGGSFYASRIKEIYLPDSVETLRGGEFQYCASLTSVSLSKKLKTIGGFTFQDCPSLTKIDLPEGLEEIGDYAFRRSGLTEIDLPDSCLLLGVDILNGTPWYENQPDGVVYCDQFLYGYKGEMLQNTVLKDLSPIRRVAERAFYGCEQLKSITFPEGCLDISENAFQNCINLQEVIFPGSLISIQAGAFSGCSKLTQIKLPENLVVLGRNAFSSCGLTNIEFPSNLTTIEGNTFASCPFTVVTIPTTIKSLSISAFSSCTGMSLIIPDSIQEVTAPSLSLLGGITNIDGTPMNIEERVKKNYQWNIFFLGDEAKWEAVKKEWEDYYKHVPVYFYSETQPEGEGNYWHYAEDGKTPVVWE